MGDVDMQHLAVLVEEGGVVMIFMGALYSY